MMDQEGEAMLKPHSSMQPVVSGPEGAASGTLFLARIAVKHFARDLAWPGLRLLRGDATQDRDGCFAFQLRTGDGAGSVSIVMPGVELWRFEVEWPGKATQVRVNGARWDWWRAVESARAKLRMVAATPTQQ